jgi:hypothetical protein
MGTKTRSSPSGPTMGEKYTVTFPMGDITAASIKRVTAAVPGVRLTDIVVVNWPSVGVTAVGNAGARVSAAGVVEISGINPTAGTLTGGDLVCKVLVAKFST